jgi:hypothetical protein
MAPNLSFLYSASSVNGPLDYTFHPSRDHITVHVACSDYVQSALLPTSRWRCAGSARRAHHPEHGLRRALAGADGKGRRRLAALTPE